MCELKGSKCCMDKNKEQCWCIYKDIEQKKLEQTLSNFSVEIDIIKPSK